MTAAISNAKVTNPFSHPRTLLADYELAEKILQHDFRTFFEEQLFSLSPAVVIQPMEKLEGGLTPIENRAFMELAMGAGAREVVVHVGEQLSMTDFDFLSIKQSMQQ